MQLDDGQSLVGPPMAPITPFMGYPHRISPDLAF